MGSGKARADDAHDQSVTDGFGLTPELLERVRRIAKHDGIPAANVLYNALQEYWVRWATRKRLKREEW